MKLTATIIRVLAFLAYGLLTYFVAFLWMQDDQQVAFWSSLIIVPFCLGTLSQMLMDWQVKRPFGTVAMGTMVWLVVLIILLITI